MDKLNQKEEVEHIRIDELFLNKKSNPNEFWKEVERNKIIRINLYHRVVHVISFLVIIPYLVLVLMNIHVPESYITIVSMVIGFYFAKSIIEKE